MKRVLSLVLALTLLLGVLAFASCGGSGDNATTTNPMDGMTTGKTEGTTTPKDPGLENPGENPNDPMPGYENVNFGGHTFTFASCINATDGWADYEVYAEEDRNGILDSAIIARNDVMFDNYECFIAVEDIDLGTLTNDFATNQNRIDIASHKYNVNSKGNGQYYNYYSLDIDLTKPWWDQGFIRDVTVDGQLYAMLGSFSLTSFDATWVMFFNKTVQEQDDDIRDIDFYELVDNNEWTLDKFLEIIKRAHSDDGDQTMTTGSGDIFGLVSSSFGIRGLYFGADQGYSIKTDDKTGKSTFTHAFTDAAVTATNKIIEIYSNEGVAIASYDVVQSQIRSGLVLFSPETLNKASMYAGKQGASTEAVQVGILPHPKLSSDQAKYKHNIDNHMIYICVPKTCTNLDRIADFLTLYAYHSYHTVYAKYLELYKYTYTTDTKAAEMVDIILQSRSFDLAYQFFWAGVDTEYINAVKEGRNVIAELRGSLGSAIEAAAVTYKEYLAANNG